MDREVHYSGKTRKKQNLSRFDALSSTGTLSWSLVSWWSTQVRSASALTYFVCSDRVTGQPHKWLSVFLLDSGKSSVFVIVAAKAVL